MKKIALCLLILPLMISESFAGPWYGPPLIRRRSLNEPCNVALIKLCASFQVCIGPKRGLTKTVTAQFPLGGDLTNRNSPKLARTLLAISLGNAIRQALVAYRDQKEPVGLVNPEASLPAPGPKTIRRKDVSSGIIIVDAVGNAKAATPSTTVNQRIARALRATLDQIERQGRLPMPEGARGETILSGSEAFQTAMASARKLAGLIEQESHFTNIISYLEKFLGPSFRGGDSLTLGGGGNLRSIEADIGALRSMPARAASKPSLALTTGGQMDAGHARELIDQGEIPTPEQFPLTAFLHEFQLSLDAGKPQGELVRPLLATHYNPDTQRFYVQADFTSDIKPETFKRPPLNLSILLDTSGSMTTYSDGGKTRIEWAKDALKQIAEAQLTSVDYISLVTFDSEARVVSGPVQATAENIAKLLRQIVSIKADGLSTNIRAGLKAAQNIVRQAKAELGANAQNFEHRVLLLSDIEHNEWSDGNGKGETVASAVEMSVENINLTAICIGSGMDGDFASQLFEKAPGSTAVSVNDGERLHQIATRQFPFLVTPVLKNLDLVLSFEGIAEAQKPKLVNVFGVPGSNGEPSVAAGGELLHLPSMFLYDTGDQSSGGGAMVFVFDLAPLFSPTPTSATSTPGAGTPSDGVAPGGNFKLGGGK